MQDDAHRFIAGFERNIWLIALQGLTPIPYKIVTISAGIAGVNFWMFTLFSAVTRSLRFVGEATLFYFFGDTAKHYLEKYMTPVLIGFFTLIVLGFVALHYLFR
jgi:membrane protein DedA with SNARE-associated domain